MKCHRQYVCLLLQVIFFITNCLAKNLILNINVKKPIAVTDHAFLSFTLDPATLQYNDFIKNIEKSMNLARGLAPAYIRLGGPQSNFYNFGQVYSHEINTDQNDMHFGTQWTVIYQWAKNTGLDVIACITPHYIDKEFKTDSTDPRNIAELLSFSDRMGYNMSWQLGYECQTRCDLSGKELGRYVVNFHEILKTFPRYSNSLITGPDIVTYKTAYQQKYLQDYLHSASAALSAITWHPNLDIVSLNNNSVSIHYDNMIAEKNELFEIINSAEKKPLWIAESKSQESKHQYLGALIWMRRLGDAAKLGIQVVMRQLTNLSQASPAYWVSLLYKTLVGREVLEIKLQSNNENYVQFYSHCTKPSALYSKGAVTIFGINLTPKTVTISLKGLKIKILHKYILLPEFETTNKIFSKKVLLNNKPLNLINDKHLPNIYPEIIINPDGLELELPSGGIGFWIIPSAKVKACTCSEEEIIENNTVKKLSKRHENSIQQPNHEEEDINQSNLKNKKTDKNESSQRSFTINLGKQENLSEEEQQNLDKKNLKRTEIDDKFKNIQDLLKKYKRILLEKKTSVIKINKKLKEYLSELENSVEIKTNIIIKIKKYFSKLYNLLEYNDSTNDNTNNQVHGDLMEQEKFRRHLDTKLENSQKNNILEKRSRINNLKDYAIKQKLQKIKQKNDGNIDNLKRNFINNKNKYNNHLQQDPLERCFKNDAFENANRHIDNQHFVQEYNKIKNDNIYRKHSKIGDMEKYQNLIQRPERIKRNIKELEYNRDTLQSVSRYPSTMHYDILKDKNGFDKNIDSNDNINAKASEYSTPSMYAEHSIYNKIFHNKRNKRSNWEKLRKLFVKEMIQEDEENARDYHCRVIRDSNSPKKDKNDNISVIPIDRVIGTSSENKNVNANVAQFQKDLTEEEYQEIMAGEILSSTSDIDPDYEETDTTTKSVITELKTLDHKLSETTEAIDVTSILGLDNVSKQCHNEKKSTTNLLPVDSDSKLSPNNNNKNKDPREKFTTSTTNNAQKRTLHNEKIQELINKKKKSDNSIYSTITEDQKNKKGHNNNYKMELKSTNLLQETTKGIVEQIDKLKEKLYARREKLLHQYQDELTKIADEQKRNLKRREAWERFRGNDDFHQLINPKFIGILLDNDITYKDDDVLRNLIDNDEELAETSKSSEFFDHIHEVFTKLKSSKAQHQVSKSQEYIEKLPIKDYYNQEHSNSLHVLDKQKQYDLSKKLAALAQEWLISLNQRDVNQASNKETDKLNDNIEMMKHEKINKSYSNSNDKTENLNITMFNNNKTVEHVENIIENNPTEKEFEKKNSRLTESMKEDLTNMQIYLKENAIKKIFDIQPMKICLPTKNGRSSNAGLYQKLKNYLISSRKDFENNDDSTKFFEILQWDDQYVLEAILNSMTEYLNDKTSEEFEYEDPSNLQSENSEIFLDEENYINENKQDVTAKDSEIELEKNEQYKITNDEINKFLKKNQIESKPGMFLLLPWRNVKIRQQRQIKNEVNKDQSEIKREVTRQSQPYKSILAEENKRTKRYYLNDNTDKEEEENMIETKRVNYLQPQTKNRDNLLEDFIKAYKKNNLYNNETSVKNEKKNETIPLNNISKSDKKILQKERLQNHMESVGEFINDSEENFNDTLANEDNHFTNRTFGTTGNVFYTAIMNIKDLFAFLPKISRIFT
ncbi:HPSE Heparanase, partial [Acromyrmex insinuator]